MKRSLIVGSLVCVAAAGCVPEEKYRAAKMEAENYRQQLSSAQVDASSAQQKADALQRMVDGLNANSGSATGLVNNLRDQLSAKDSELAAMNAKYAEAMAQIGSASALPVPLTNELSTLAAGSPDLIEFDAGRGVVKFKSDLTFDLGDAAIKPAAKEVLTKFAAILNSPAASQYELLVAGHTDNVPVSNPATLAKGHKNNWYLSAHRAITVGEELTKDKVSPQRIGVVGYADQHPVASNTSDAGRAQNRRVEVLILPTQVRATTQPAATVTPAKATSAAGGKDAAGPTPAQDTK